MTQTITATFEDGVFKLTGAVELPEKTQVLLTVELLQSETQKQSDATKEERLAKRRCMTREERNFRRSYD
jgi:predicted DNA-binding antitoxin AbrB/MazE fold protein